MKAFVKLVTKYLNERRFDTLPSHKRTFKIVHRGRSLTTVHWAWELS